MYLRRRRTAATGLTALLAAGLTVAAASAATAPSFLDPSEMPPHPSSSWQAGEVTQGLPDPLPFCVGEALPAAQTSYRLYTTELDAGGAQYVVGSANEAEAERLVRALRTAVENCAEEYEAADPEAVAEYKSFGKALVADGAYVYGVHTAHPEVGSQDIAMFGIGRDGRDVTVVQWGQMGDFGDAQVADFRKTTKRAVAKLR
ncbi:hypothetical protein GCM10027168_14470 [Streptomyces capparidis]